MRTQNIILFSSGVSEGNGILDAVRSEFEKLGYRCSGWRELFRGANDPQNIALLPILIKKIPSFDFAFLICEGHDTTEMLRGGKEETARTMRDNVLFEIGLCTMALGMNRVILLTDVKVRLPEDLTGRHHETALKVIEYRPEDKASYQKATEEAAAYVTGVSAQPLAFEGIAGVIHDADVFIHDNHTLLSPTVIGAAVSTANGYYSNFVLRVLEKCNEGFLLDGSEELRFFPDDKIFMHIVLPEAYSDQTPVNVRAKMSRYKTGFVPSARFRRAEFRYEIRGDELHIVDYPTTLVTSYQTARLILKIDSDEAVDPMAEIRYNAKELDLFRNALSALLSRSFIEATVRHFYEDDTEEEENALIDRLAAMMGNVTIETEVF